MKTLSGTFAFKLTLLAAVAIASFFTFHACTKAHSVGDRKFVLNIPQITEVKSEKDFVNVLNRISKKGALCKIKMVHNDNSSEDGPPFKEIATTNITRSQKSGSQKSETGGARVNVSQLIASNDPADLTDVLNTF
jgi:hypothetical protein